MATADPHDNGVLDVGSVLLPSLPECHPLDEDGVKVATEPFAKDDISHDKERKLNYIPWPKIADRLDALCGVGGWRMVRQTLREQDIGNRVCVIWEGLLYGTKINPPIQTTGHGFYSTSGGRSSPRDAIEAAESRALTKAAGKLGIGRHMWLKEEAEARQRSDSPAPRRGQGSNAPTATKPAANGASPAQKAFWAKAAEHGFKGQYQDRVYGHLGIPKEGEHPLTAGWLEPAEALGITRDDAYRIAAMVLPEVVAEVKRQKDAGEANWFAKAVAIVDPFGQLKKTAPASAPTTKAAAAAPDTPDTTDTPPPDEGAEQAPLPTEEAPRHPRGAVLG